MAIPELGISHALLLQGPAGPFMRRFADDLVDAGVRVTKVNFHAGDVLFFPGPDSVSFRGTFESWPTFVRELMIRRRIDGLFVFGDCRPLHRAAIAEAESLEGLQIWAFEEGYLRPDWITCERHGVNGNSRMPRDPAYYLGLDIDEAPPREKIGARMPLLSWYSTLNALAFTLLNQGFPHYEHHRILNAWFHTYVWVRNVIRKQVYATQEKDMLPLFTGELSGRYFFVPLQVHCDFQIQHSPYDNVLEHAEQVVAAFAEHAPSDAHLLFKHHPMDRAYKEYREFFEQLALDAGLVGRIHYCHDLHLPTLLRNARGTITINSTVGLQSIGERTPTITMGTAIYDMPGLTHQGDLRSFLRDPCAVDEALYAAFRRYLLAVNQINGTFYKRLSGYATGAGVRWFRMPNGPGRDRANLPHA